MRCAVEASELPSPLPPELRRAESRSQLGVMLLRDGHLTVGQLEEALTEKESRGGRLGEILVEHGWVTGAVVAEALAEQHGLELLDAGHIDVDPAALSLLPEKLARRYEALPIRFLDQNTVLIAVADPTNVLASTTSASRSASTSGSRSLPGRTSCARSAASTELRWRLKRPRNSFRS